MASKFWKAYDRIYAKKDYDAEIAAILPLFKDAKTLLEIGCGTGEHTKRLAPHFQGMIALDMDEDAVEIARKKKAANVVLIHSRLEDFHGTNVGGAVALFNVVHYLQTPYWLEHFLDSVFRRIKPGATFVFDCWNWDAVALDPPLTTSDGMVCREPVVDFTFHLVDVKMTIDAGDVGRFVHVVHHKIWTMDELYTALTSSGFTAIRARRWMEPNEPATAKDWKIMFICERAP